MSCEYSQPKTLVSHDVIPAQFPDGNFFLSAIKQHPENPLPQAIHGITVPHHLLAADLIAQTFNIIATHSYDRVIILSPDHFYRCRTKICTTRSDWSTAFDMLHTDTDAINKLLADPDVSLEQHFFYREHGIGGITPFVKYFFPDANVVALSIKEDTSQNTMDALVRLLETVVDDKTLIVQSTDFSHYLPPDIAATKDQQTLRILASDSGDLLWKLSQPGNLDSTAGEYAQLRIQRDLFGAFPTIIANKNSQSYTSDRVDHSTSYVTQVFSPTPVNVTDDHTYFFGGDTFFGRGMVNILHDPAKSQALLKYVLDITHSAKMIVNLEGVVMPRCPTSLTPWQLCMEQDVTIDMLKKLHVVAVSLANNHAYDFRKDAYEMMKKSLTDARIKVLERKTVTEFPEFDIAALTDVDNRQEQKQNLLHQSDINAALHTHSRQPLLTFIHWGDEYSNEVNDRQQQIAKDLETRGSDLIIGAHSHRATALDCTLDRCIQGSLGNLIFDQTRSTVSGKILEVRFFDQGTYSLQSFNL